MTDNKDCTNCRFDNLPRVDRPWCGKCAAFSKWEPAPKEKEKEKEKEKDWAPAFDFIGDRLCGQDADWMDAIEAIGVRYIEWNGLHRAYLGKNKPSWTNATVAVFSNEQEAKDWCDKTNEIFEIE